MLNIESHVSCLLFFWLKKGYISEEHCQRKKQMKWDIKDLFQGFT